MVTVTRALREAASRFCAFAAILGVLFADPPGQIGPPHVVAPGPERLPSLIPSVSPSPPHCRQHRKPRAGRTPPDPAQVPTLSPLPGGPGHMSSPSRHFPARCPRCSPRPPHGAPARGAGPDFPDLRRPRVTYSPDRGVQAGHRAWGTPGPARTAGPTPRSPGCRCLQPGGPSRSPRRRGYGSPSQRAPACGEEAGNPEEGDQEEEEEVEEEEEAQAQQEAAPRRERPEIRPGFPDYGPPLQGEGQAPPLSQQASPSPRLRPRPGPAHSQFARLRQPLQVSRLAR